MLGWDEVSLEEGTGIVHIAPGAGAEDFELGVRDGLPVLVPVDEAGAFYPGYGELTGLTTAGASDPIIAHLEGGGWLLRAEDYHHRYPGCWRCGTELIFRVVDEWFIRCDEIREPMIEAARTVEWTPPQYGKRMEDWLRNMVDWCISRKRYWGLPLPFWTCPDGHLTVISSRKDLRERALSGLEGVEELHRPWIDEVKVRCSTCDAEATRVPEVGDAWLDAGIIPFSTLGWRNEVAIPEGYADGAGVGLTRADLPSHDDWERWFPADWISEMREQIRLWFYSQLFMSVTLVGQAPYRRVLGHEKLHDETGRAMHKSWGNAIWFDDAIEQIGADVMRWMYAAQPPSQNMNFGYGPASEVNRTLADAVEQLPLPRAERQPRGLAAVLAGGRRGPAQRTSARPLDPRPGAGARARCALRPRPLRNAGPRARRRALLGRPLELVRAPVAAALLEGRARRLRDPPSRPRHALPRGGTGHAVPEPRSCGATSSRAGAAPTRPGPCISRATPSTIPSGWTRACWRPWPTHATSWSSGIARGRTPSCASVSRSRRWRSRRSIPPGASRCSHSPTRSQRS